jgi:hypothetical protein
MDGPGDTVILKVMAGPEQAESMDCTVIILVWGVVTLAALKLRLPVPEMGKPMAVLSLNQVGATLFGWLVKLTLMG